VSSDGDHFTAKDHAKITEASFRFFFVVNLIELQRGWQFLHVHGRVPFEVSRGSN